MFKKIFFLILMVCSVSCAKPLHKDTFVISGTYLEVTSPYSQAGRIVYNEFKRLDKVFNLYDSSSEISRLNKTYNTPFKASKELIEALKLSVEVNEMSRGGFDVSYGALYGFWKGLMREEEIKSFPGAEEVKKIKEAGGMRNIEINSAEGTILIKKEGLKVDLSAIAKGYMVDKAVQKLEKQGMNSALINAGGDIYCLGLREGGPWKIGIKDPGELLSIMESQVLVNEAVATSGNYERFFEFKGEKHSHLINPKTGYPVKNNILSVSVITKNCTTADSLASAFFVMGIEGIEEFLSKNPSTMRIFVVVLDEEGKKSVRVFQ